MEQTTKSRRGFTMVSDKLMASTSLSSNQKVLIAYCLRWQMDRKKTCRKSNEELAKLFGTKYHTVRGWCRELNAFPFFQSIGDSKEINGRTGAYFNTKEMVVDEKQLVQYLDAEADANAKFHQEDRAKRNDRKKARKEAVADPEPTQMQFTKQTGLNLSAADIAGAERISKHTPPPSLIIDATGALIQPQPPTAGVPTWTKEGVFEMCAGWQRQFVTEHGAEQLSPKQMTIRLEEKYRSEYQPTVDPSTSLDVVGWIWNFKKEVLEKA